MHGRTWEKGRHLSDNYKQIDNLSLSVYKIEVFFPYYAILLKILIHITLIYIIELLYYIATVTFDIQP